MLLNLLENCQPLHCGVFDRFVRLHSGLAWNKGKTKDTAVDRISYSCMIKPDNTFFLMMVNTSKFKINCTHADRERTAKF